MRRSKFRSSENIEKNRRLYKDIDVDIGIDIDIDIDINRKRTEIGG